MAIVAGVLYALERNLAHTDVILMGVVAVLLTLTLASDRFPTPQKAAALLGNEGLVPVGVLFVVAAGSPRRARSGC